MEKEIERIVIPDKLLDYMSRKVGDEKYGRRTI